MPAMNVLLKDYLETTEEKLPKALRKELIAAAELLTLDEIVHIVRLYYRMQDFRKETKSQERSLGEAGKPHDVVSLIYGAMDNVEGNIRTVLDHYTLKVDPTGMGQWARGNVGIGPVIAAGLLAHLDVTNRPSVAHFWRYAGLDPTVRWHSAAEAAKMVAQVVPEKEKITADHLAQLAQMSGWRMEYLVKSGADKDTGNYTRKAVTGAICRRPWNADLKVLAWKAGESFMKFSNHPKCHYGHVYAERKQWELARNAKGAYAEQAARALREKNYDKSTVAFASYAKGELPLAHITERAKRYAVKLFIADYHAEAYQRKYGKEPPLPYPVAHLGHAEIHRAWDGEFTLHFGGNGTASQQD